MFVKKKHFIQQLIKHVNNEIHIINKSKSIIKSDIVKKKIYIYVFF